MVVEITKWFSLALMWLATALNVYALVRMKRTQRELDNQVRIWKARNKYEEENNMAEIRIVVPEANDITIEGTVAGLTEVDKIMILNSLAEGMLLTREQKKIIGIILYGGGLDALGVTGKEQEVIEEDMIRVITKMGERK